jgi:serine protease SohB
MTVFYSLLIFSLKIIIMVIALLLLVAGITAIKSKGRKQTGKISIKPLNSVYQEVSEAMQDQVLTKKERKQLKKMNKANKKDRENNTTKKLFVLEFEGDIKASGVESLREEITAILTTATKADEVVVKLASPGGVVHGYGLAASQLDRIKDRGIQLTIAVDMVAASGGYMMACVADKIIAAPFAIIGSIGVVIQLPNFHRFLKKHNVDFEQLTAGDHKRTLSLFGENTSKGRDKMQEDIEDVHQLFKDFIRHHRPQVDLEKVATGEHWFGTRALDLQLVDELITSDDYLFKAKESADIYHIEFATKKSLSSKVLGKAQQLLSIT